RGWHLRRPAGPPRAPPTTSRAGSRRTLRAAGLLGGSGQILGGQPVDGVLRRHIRGEIGAAEPRQQADQRVGIGSASAADPRQGGGGYACLASDRTPTEAVAAAASVERDVQRVGVESEQGRQVGTDLHTMSFL